MPDLSNASSIRDRVFLCHASEDKPHVRNLYELLKRDGFKPWLDEEDLLPGQAWKEEIAKALRVSAFVLVCLSRHSITKPGFVNREIRDALDLAAEQPEGSIFLIPVKLEECDIPARLRDWHWVNLFDERGYERLVASLHSRLPANLASKETEVGNPDDPESHVRQQVHPPNQRAREQEKPADEDPLPPPLQPKLPPPWARALLLYAPSGGTSWVLRILFYVYFWAVLYLLIVCLSDLSNPDVVFNLLGVYLLCFPAEFLRRLALRHDRRKWFPAKQQIVRSRKRWIPIILFWYATMAIPFGAIAPFMDEPGGFTIANLRNLYPASILFATYLILLAVCARGWVNALAIEASTELPVIRGVRSALLLYPPNRPPLAMIGFFASPGFLSIYLVWLVRVRKGIGADDIGPGMLVLFFCFLLILAAKGWASQYRPRGQN